MGSQASKPSGAGLDSSTQTPGATCPLGFDKKDKSNTSSGGGVAGASREVPEASGCPVKHSPTASSDSSGRGSSATSKAGEESNGGSACPVKKENRAQMAAKYLHPHKYNVYSQRVEGQDSKATGTSQKLDPTNNMPAKPNQQPAPGQQAPLSTERVKSTIPKGGEETTWTYPSPQMFWNALSRKGKADDTEEGDMDVVVSIHNNMNELTWKKILQWEKLRGGRVSGGPADGTEPRLLRFQGRPDDITPKALAKMMLGHPLPFDRHDWVVDRGGDERRYIIDYYHDEGVSDGDEVPELHSEGAVKSIKVDVRPALDGIRDFTDRVVQMPLSRLMGSNDFTPLPLRPSPTMKAREPRVQVLRSRQSVPKPSAGRTDPRKREKTPAGSENIPPASSLSSSSSSSSGSGGDIRERDARAMARMKKKCAKPLKSLRAAEEAEDAQRAEAAALKLEYCTARYLCKKEARAYKEAVTYVDALSSVGPAHAHWAEGALEDRLHDMRAALARFTARQMEAAHHKGREEKPPDA